MRTVPAAVVAAFSFLLALIGVWLVIAPTAIGYQPAIARWADATWNDVVVGAVLVLGGLGLLLAQLVALVRSRMAAAAGA